MTIHRVEQREEENFSLPCIQNDQKDERKKLETFHETLVECSNDSEASREKRLFVEYLKNNSNQILIFSNKKTITVDPVLNKQNDPVLTFEIMSLNTAEYEQPSI